MALDLSNTLVVGISATALFDMSESDQMFKAALEADPESVIDNYRRYMQEREDEPLVPGTGYHLVKALLDLNRHMKAEDTSPLVEVVVMSRNSPDTGIRVLKTIRRDQLAITRSAFTGGESVADYMDAFDVDLFLTTNVEDAQKVIDSRQCAAAILKAPPANAPQIPEGQVRIAFDGDAVLFSDASELVYKTQGLDAFKAQEDALQHTPMDEGPYASLLIKLARLQERLPTGGRDSPIRIAIVNARNSPSEMRVINTLRAWGVYVDEAFFLGGGWQAQSPSRLQPAHLLRRPGCALGSRCQSGTLWQSAIPFPLGPGRSATCGKRVDSFLRMQRNAHVSAEVLR